MQTIIPANAPLVVPARRATMTGINVAASAYPFTTGMESYIACAGMNIAEILEYISGFPLEALVGHVYLNEQYIPKEYWHVIYPKENTTLTVKLLPGKGKKNPLGIVLMVAVVAVAAWAGPALAGAMGFKAGTVGFTIASSLGSAAVNAVGSLLINAIAPPAQRKSGATGNTTSPATQFIQGARNTVDYYGVVPVVLGRCLHVPPLAALTYTETSGEKQYARQLFCLGMGKYNVYNPSIGTTAITEYDEVELNQYTAGEGEDANLQLYTNSVYQEDLSLQLTHAADWVIRTSQPSADEVILDYTYPKGMTKYDDNGKKQTTSVTIEVQWSVAGANTWSTSSFVKISASTTAAQRKSLRLELAGGTYDIRQRRVTTDATSDKVFNESWLTSIKTVTYENPVALKGVSLAEMRILATDQLNGAVDQFGQIQYSVIPDYDEATDTWIERESNNPASLFRWVAQNSALFRDGGGNPLVDSPNARPLTDDRLIIADLEDFHTYCKDQGYTYNAVINFEISVWDMLTEIAAAGRAAPSLVDGKWTVIIDRVQTTYAQYFTPANTWGYTAVKVFPELPDAIRVTFANELKGFNDDEMLVYNDGFNKDNARKIEGLELKGITHPNAVWKHVREHLATMKLRPIEHSFYCDVEHLVATRGRLIKFAHDVPLIGVGQGYIKEVLTDGGSPANVVGVILDRAVTMQAGKQYSLRIRSSVDLTSLYKSVLMQVGNTDYLTFVTPFPASTGAHVDELFMFGETGTESIDLVVKDIFPDKDFTAKLVCVDAAPEIFQASQGTIPEFVSSITLPAELQRPASPIIKQIQTGAEVQVRNADGSVSSRMVITLENVNGFDVVPVVNIRNADATDFSPATILFANATQVIIDGLDQDVRYDLSIIYRRVGNTSSYGINTNVFSAPTVANLVYFDGITDNPPNVANLQIQLVNGLALLTWDAVTVIDFDHYEIRYTPNLTGVSWYTAISVKDNLQTNETVLAAGTGTYLIKAFDTGGRSSALETTVSLSVVNEGVNAVETITEDPTFAGTHSNTLVTGDDRLELDDLTLGTGTYIFSDMVDLTDVYPCRVIPHIVANGRNIGNTLDQWPNLSEVTSLAGSDPSTWSVALEEAHTDDDPTGSPVWTAWAPITIGNYIFRAQKYRITLTGNGSNVTPSIEELSVLVDMPDRVEKGLNITVSGTGIDITYSPAFKATPVFTYALIDGQALDQVIVTSETASGCHVQVTNAGMNVTRHINYHTIGYGRVQ